jgi:DNA-binding transcriptional LysR family regulator
MKNWDDLKIFQAMASARSVREAAVELKTTHATVSRRIRALETELGHTLFERGRDGYQMTDFARGIFDFTETIADNVSAIDRLAFAKERGLEGAVRLSLLEDLFTYVLADALSAFMSQNPMIELIVDTTASFSDLSRRESDVIVRITREPPEYAIGRRVANSPLAAYASQDYIDERPMVDRWIALDYPPALEPLLQSRAVFRTNSLQVVTNTLQRGQGIGLLPCFIGDQLSELVRVPEIPQMPDMEIWVLTHEDVHENPRVRALMDHLYQAFSQCRQLIEGNA